MSAKQAALDLIRSLPDDVSADGILAALGVRDCGQPLAEEEDEDLTREEWEEAWGEEVERRIADADAGRSFSIPGDLVMRWMREKYG